MSVHFSISLGLIIACGAHVFIFLNLDINQDIKVLKKENTLNIVLNKIPERKTVFETPISAPPTIEKVEQVETPIQKPRTPSKKTKNKKTPKKQVVRNKKQKKEIVETVELPKNSVKIDEQLEIPQETSSSVSEEQIPEITPQKNKTKTISCEEYSYCPEPQYPFVAKQRNIEKGRVRLELKIDEKGTVVDVKILASEPEDIFEDAALEAVLQWKNLPEQLFNSTVEQTITFELRPED